MPSILEQVQPSWIEDGGGIQGEQDEYRFDDDIPWDITAWTRDNQTEDSDQLCCEKKCPCIEFSDVQFCCIEDINTEFYEDVFTNPFAVLNGRPFCLAQIGDTPCLHCSNDDLCDGTLNAGGLTIRARLCDTHDPAGSTSIFLDVATISGVRYIRAYPASDPASVFYFGTSAGNEIVSCGGTINIDGPFTDCVYGGCCVEDFDCFQSAEGYCGNVGGTWLEGTPCDPNPC